MYCVFSLLLLSTLFGTAIGCLPGLGLGGGGGGGCCSPAQPSCGSPCGGAGAPPSPVYAAAPLAPAPFASYPQAPPPSPPGPFPVGGGFAQQPLPVQSGYVASAGNFQTGSVQGGQVQGGGAYLADPVQQVQPLPLLGQPVAYEKTVVSAPVQQSLSTSQVLTKVMPASAVLDERVAEPAAASPNNIVTSIQTGYGDEQQQTQVFHAQPAGHSSSSSSSSSASSSSASAEHHATHQVRVPSASSSVEANERVVPDVVVQRIIETFESTPFPQQVALQTAAPFVPAQQHVVAPQVVPHVAPHVAPTVQQHVVEPVQPIHTIQPIQPAPVQQVPLQPAQHVPVAVATQAPTHYVPETKVVAEEDRIEAQSGSDYDQPTDVAANEQATVNELLATLDTATSTVASNLDFNQVTVEPNQNQQPDIIQTEGDDYDAPLNEDRKDVPTAEPSRNVSPSAPQPVAVVPEETAPIIPQPIQPIQPVQTYQPSVTSAPVAESTVGYVQPEPARPEVHLQPIVPSVRVEVTTVAAPEPAPTPAFELPIEVHEVVTPQVPLQPEPAVIQTITEQPIAEVTVEVLPTSAAPVSQFFENITSKEDKEEPEAPFPSQPEPVSASVAPAQVISGNDYDEEKSVENKVSTETDAVPNLGEYGSKFAKVQGAGTKQVSQPIEIETIENANPYGRKYWIF